MSDDKNLSRRDVLGRGLAAAFAMGVPASVARAAYAAQDPQGAAADAAKRAKDARPVKVAWIGAGVQGRGQDMASLLKMPGVEIVAVADIYPPNLEKGVKDSGPNCKGYDDYRRVLDRKDVEAVGIAVPLNVHAPIALDALNAGKHVYCEKMMAYTVEDARKMVKAAEAHDRILQIGHQRRYSVDYHHANDLIKKGYIGPVTHVRAQWNRNGSWRRAVPDNDAKLEKLINWRLYKASSRGLMAELGSHQIDVVNWFLGLHPVSVVGIGGLDTYKDGREIYDNVQVIFEYPNGTKLCYQSIQSNAFDADGEQFMGPKGTLQMSEQSGNKNMIFQEKSAELEFAKFSQNKTKVGNKEAIVLDAGATTKQDKRGKADGTTLASAGTSTAGKTNWYLALEDWIDCIRTNRKPFCDGRIGLGDVVCVLAANKAMETGTKVYITEDMFKV